MRRGFVIACLVLSLTACVCTTAAAQGGRISMGKLKVIPSLGVEAVYDDNIYLGSGTNDTTEVVTSDWIFHVVPGLLLDYSLEGRGSIKLGYEGDWAYYLDEDQNDWNNQKGLFDLDYQAPGGLIVGIKNVYVDAEDPFGSDNQFKLGVPQTMRWYNDFLGRVGYEFSNRFRVLAYYDYYKQKYKLESDFTQNYKMNNYGGGFEVRVAPKTWGFIRYFSGNRDYYGALPSSGVTEENDADFSYNQVSAGLTWDSGAKFSGEFNVGYYWREYDNEFDSFGNRFEDKNTWVAETRINYFATSATTLSLDLIRALRDTGSNTNQYYTDTGIALGLAQVFLTRFTLTAKAAYAQYDYNVPVNPEKESDNYLFSVGINYRILAWLSGGVAYSYLKQDSNYPEDNYKDNRFMVSLRAVY